MTLRCGTQCTPPRRIRMSACHARTLAKTSHACCFSLGLNCEGTLQWPAGMFASCVGVALQALSIEAKKAIPHGGNAQGVRPWKGCLWGVSQQEKMTVALRALCATNVTTNFFCCGSRLTQQPASVCTRGYDTCRVDAAYAASVLGQANASPNTKQLKEAKHALGYLNGISSMGIGSTDRRMTTSATDSSVSSTQATATTSTTGVTADTSSCSTVDRSRGRVVYNVS